MQSKTINQPALLVWDEDGHPPQGDWNIVLWRTFGEDNNPNVLSIPKLVEEQAGELKSRYLALIYELGETNINGKRLVDQLILRKGFSYWWMTLLAEKSYWKSPRVYDAIRLFALEELIKKSQSTRIKLVSSDQTVATILRHYCRKAEISFEWKQALKQPKHKSLKRRLYDSLPRIVQSAIFLFLYVKDRWSLKNLNDFKNAFTSDITIVDYLIHLNSSSQIQGRFASNYWTKLIDLINQTNITVNWLHIYIPHEEVPNSEHARDLIFKFNQNGSRFQSHSMLEGAITLSLIFSVLRDYLKIIIASIGIRKIKYSFRPTFSDLDLWPLFKQDWLNSMRGPNAMWNCLVINQFEKTLNQLPHQKLGVYLQENQGWEVAFIYAWRSAKHGRLISVPHSTVRYWDLRYFFDPRSYKRTGKNDLPLPDQLALNSPMALKAYWDGSYPKNKLVEVEALRYLYLTDKDGSRAQNTDSSHDIRVLVCGDIMPAVSQQMMRWLEATTNNMPPNTRFIVKPHPACQIKATDYPSLKLEMTSAPLAELLLDCDVAFTSNTTSAAVDVYCFGIPIVQVLDGNAFNMSPLRGLKGVVYVTNPLELSKAMHDARLSGRVIVEPYFWLDKDLPRWKKLLEDFGYNQNTTIRNKYQ